MKRDEKAKVIDDLKKMISRSEAAFIMDYRGLKVGEIGLLRRSLKDASADFRVVKNTLARLSCKDTALDGLTGYFNGPTAIAFIGSDPVPAAKVIAEFAKENPNLKIKMGVYGGKMLGKDDIRTLSQLPGIERLRGKIIMLLSSPSARLVSLTRASGTQLARVLKVYSEGGQESKINI